MNIKNLAFSLLILIPAALHAMETKKDAACYEEALCFYGAGIVDANKQELTRTAANAFGSYMVTSTWTSDDVAKVATVKYLIKKNGTTIVDDATKVPYESAVYKPLDESNQLKLWYTKGSDLRAFLNSIK